MAYRNERDALRERMAALEHDLAEARHSAQHAEELGRVVKAKQKEVDQLRRQLDVQKPTDVPSARPRAATIGAAVAVLVLVAAGGVGFMLRRGRSQTPPATAASAATPIGPRGRSRPFCALEAEKGSSTAFCYGFPVRPNVLVTDGACVDEVVGYFPAAPNGQRSPSGRVDVRCRVIRQGVARPKASSTRVRRSREWSRVGDPAHNYAAVLLERGETFEAGQVLPLESASDAVLTDSNVEIMWSLGDLVGKGTARITSVGPQRLFARNGRNARSNRTLGSGSLERSEPEAAHGARCPPQSL